MFSVSKSQKHCQREFPESLNKHFYYTHHVRMYVVHNVLLWLARASTTLPESKLVNDFPIGNFGTTFEK